MLHRHFESFAEFWPFYASEHADRANRQLHFIGTTCVIGCVASAIFAGHFWLLALAPLCGYGFAWVGHFLVEKNRPATFQHPLYSLAGDFVMYKKMWLGEMDEEVRAALEKFPRATGNAAQ